MESTARFLIVNADDFGRSPGTNLGVARAYEHGVVTSASLMVRWPAAAAAAAYARRHPDLSVGLHFDVGEWICRDGRWISVYRVVDPDASTQVDGEARRQLDRFRRLMGRDPTHFDSHQHVHRTDPIRSVLVAMARDLGVPLRENSSVVRYCGDFYGQSGTSVPLPEAITVENLVRLLSELSPGFTELGCHPAGGPTVGSAYGEEREQELAVLCDPRVADALASHGIRLRSFRDVPPTGLRRGRSGGRASGSRGWPRTGAPG